MDISFFVLIAFINLVLDLVLLAFMINLSQNFFNMRKNINNEFRHVRAILKSLEYKTSFLNAKLTSDSESSTSISSIANDKAKPINKVNGSQAIEEDVELSSITAKELLDQYEAGELSIQAVNISNANLAWTNLSNIDLSKSNLKQTNLSGANLTYSNLNYCNLAFADLSRSDLTGSKLMGANLEGANLSEAVIENIYFDKNTRFPKDFDVSSIKIFSQEVESILIDTTNYEWSNIVAIYNNYPDGLEPYTIAVAETHESISRRRVDASISQVTLSSSDYNNYSYWIASGQDNASYWLVPKSRFQFRPSSFDTFQALFEFQGQPNEKFTMIKPAKVEYNATGEWELVEKGEVQFLK